MFGGICPSPLMSCMYCTFDVLYISKVLFGIACLAYHTGIKFALYQLLYPEFIVNSFDIKRAAATFVQFVAHSMANINVVNFAGGYMFGEPHTQKYSRAEKCS